MGASLRSGRLLLPPVSTFPGNIAWTRPRSSVAKVASYNADEAPQLRPDFSGSLSAACASYRRGESWAFLSVVTLASAERVCILCCGLLPTWLPATKSERADRLWPVAEHITNIQNSSGQLCRRAGFSSGQPAVLFMVKQILNSVVLTHLIALRIGSFP